jgi:type I restriction enzyme, S subunit
MPNFAYQVLQLSSGTAQPQLPIRDLRTFQIILPPLAEQRAITAVLSPLDQKIQLLREQNAALEALAQTIFKEWFVRFHYPHATGEMVDSELGKIPKGWRIGTLGDEFDITIGRTPPRKETQWFSKTPTGKKWASIKNIVKSGVYIFETSEYITDEAIKRFNIPIIPKNTTILSFKMTVGKLSITTEDMLSNEAIAHLKIKRDGFLTTQYIYLFLYGLDFNSLGSTSSIVTAINSKIIKLIPFLIPNHQTIRKFDELIAPIFAKIKNNTSQIQTLAKTRDTLLPKLMSGAVRVPITRSSTSLRS